MIERLDDFDIRILETLAEHGRMTWGELADRIGLSQTPTVRRVRALESEGYITGYHAMIDEVRLGAAMSVFISVSLEAQTDETLAQFESSVIAMPAVMNCFMMTGASDYLLRVVVPDLASFQTFISQLARTPGVSRLTSSFSVKSVIQRTAPPLPRRRQIQPHGRA